MGSRYSLIKILKVKVTAARSKVKSSSHHNTAHTHTPHTHPQSNVPTKFQLSTPYSFQDVVKKDLKGQVIMTRSCQGQTMMLHNYNPNQNP